MNIEILNDHFGQKGLRFGVKSSQKPTDLRQKQGKTAAFLCKTTTFLAENDVCKQAVLREKISQNSHFSH